MFLAPFFKNETARFALNNTILVHCSPQKKGKEENSVVLNNIVLLLLLLDAHRQGKKKEFSPVFSLSLPPLAQTLTKPTPFIAYNHHGRGRGDMLCKHLWGDCTKATPATLPCPMTGQG
jgi:hypothetical protein